MAAADTNQPSAGKNSPERIVTAALTLLDECGLPDLTMRRIASSLGVQPGALYWHFPNKQLLLAALSERITAGAARVSPGASWDETVKTIGVAFRDSLLAHRDGGELVSSSYALGLIDLTCRKEIEQVCVSGGLSVRHAISVAHTLVIYTLGFVFHEQQHMYAQSLGVVPDLDGITAIEVKRSEFPDGLDLIVSGTRATLSRAT